MKTILKHPKFNEVIKCKHCNCEFNFEYSDIETDYTVNAYGDILTANSKVSCPVCGVLCAVKFIKGEE